MVGLPFTREGEFLKKAERALPAAAEVTQERLRQQVESRKVDAAFNIFRTRIDQFGVVAPNIQKLPGQDGPGFCWNSRE